VLGPYAQEDSLNFSLSTLPFVEFNQEYIEFDLIYSWITSIIRVAEDKLLKSVLQISKLTPFGKKQLSTDLLSLKNAMAVLDIDIKEEFDYCLVILQASEEDIKVKLLEEKDSKKREITKTMIKTLGINL
jgi:hypothetical protein